MENNNAITILIEIKLMRKILLLCKLVKCEKYKIARSKIL